MAMKKTGARRSHCPTAFALGVFGDRWTLLIVRDLMFRGKQRYKEFLESDEGMATNILADRLVKLEANRLITKAPDPSNRRSFIYALTQKGCDLAPAMVEIIRWSAKHDAESDADAAFVRRAEIDRAGLLAKIADDLAASRQV